MQKWAKKILKGLAMAWEACEMKLQELHKLQTIQARLELQARTCRSLLSHWWLLQNMNALMRGEWWQCQGDVMMSRHIAVRIVPLVWAHVITSSTLEHLAHICRNMDTTAWHIVRGSHLLVWGGCGCAMIWPPHRHLLLLLPHCSCKCGGNL